MAKIDDMIKEHFIPHDYELERFIESFYDNKDDVEKLKSRLVGMNSVNESSDDDAPVCNLKHIDRVVLIGEKKFTSIRKAAPKLDYADPDKLEYRFTKDGIRIDDGENRFTLKESDSTSTIVIVISGYTDKIIRFLINEIVKMGILVLNDPCAVNVSNNKYLIANVLDKYGIPQPKYALITSNDIDKEDTKKAEDKLKTIYPKMDDDTKFVCKILGGHGGKGVFLCTKFNIMSILQCIFAINPDTGILVQEYMEIDEGDIRGYVLTLNGRQEIIASALRKRTGDDFRTNLSLGNDIDNDFKITKEQEKLILDTAKASGLVWCGVDLLPLKNGRNVIIEYNGAPGPPSEIDSDDIEEKNEEFYTKFIEKINELC